MCGRFALSTTPADLAGVFGTRNPVPNFAPTWNLPPSQPAPVVRHNPQTGERHLDLLRWGLIPHFVRDLASVRMLNNARAETVAKLPSFRGAFAARRCIVPAEAFYEWKRDGKLKQRFAIARADGAPLAFGGSWESWTDPASGRRHPELRHRHRGRERDDGADPRPHAPRVGPLRLAGMARGGGRRSEDLHSALRPMPCSGRGR